MPRHKKVLLISANFPPTGGGGVVRTCKMAKYLGDYGYQVYVLTRPPAHDAIIDESMLSELPPTLHIVRSRQAILQGRIIPFQYFWYFWWARASVPLGKKIIQQEGIDVLWTTSNPPLTHLLGYWLKRATCLPWIADFRDPWTQNIHMSTSWWRIRLEEKMERRVLASADIVTTVTPSFVKNFQTTFGDVIRRIELIYNGFDPDDYTNIEPLFDDGKFTAAYAGILYPTRSPRLLLEAVAELIEAGDVRRDDIRLRFAGRFDTPGEVTHRDLVHRLRLEDVVEVMGQLPHHQVLAVLKGAHLLLLIGDTLPNAGDYIPGKLYEYMAIGRPILALQVEGEAQRIVEAYDLGPVVHPLDKGAIKATYLRMYQAWREENRQGRLRLSPRETKAVHIEIFNRRFQTRQLAQLMDDLLLPRG